MSTPEQILLLFLYAVLIVGTGHVSYAYGVKCGAQTERLLADRRVRGVLAGKTKPKKMIEFKDSDFRQKTIRAPKAKMIKVGEVSVPALIVKTSKRG